MGDAHAVNLLLSADPPVASVDERDTHGNTSLMNAARAGHALVVATLLDAGANVDSYSNADHAWTALRWAARWGHTKCVKLLLAAGAAPDIQFATPAMKKLIMRRRENVVSSCDRPE